MELFSCDCQQLPAAEATDHLILFSGSQHVTRRLGRLCGDAEAYAGGPGWQFLGDQLWLAGQLVAVAAGLRPGELAQVQVLPLLAGQPAYWQARPLEQWLTLHATAWFPEDRKSVV